MQQPSTARRTTTPLRITALGVRSEAFDDPGKRPYRDHVRAVELERTGVACDWPVPPRDWTLDKVIDSAAAAGTMPHVIASASLFEEPAHRKVLLDRGVAREVTVDDVKKHMPLYCARLRRYGRSVEEVLAEHRPEGGNRYVPVGFSFRVFPNLVDHPAARELAITPYYTLAFRDDVLKRVFPRARTEAELQDLFVRKGGLDISDLVDDIPLASLEDLRRYLEAVKSLGLSEEDGPVIPGSLAAVPDPASIFWSLCTATGYFWSSPLLLGDPPDWNRTVHFWLTPEGRGMLSWWNRAHRDGLVDPQLFDLTNEQFVARQCGGRYAVINDWFSSEDAREAARGRGYGYRSFPVFYGRWKSVWSNYACPAPRLEHPLVFTRRIASATDLGRVMRWADWHLGEERDELAYWGLPGWYTGSGTDRRYTWERHALEDWSVYGIASDGDGDHIGLERVWTALRSPVAGPRMPAWPFSFFGAWMGYPEAPAWVYPWEPRKLLKVTSFAACCLKIIRDARYAEYRIVYRGDQSATELFRDVPEALAYSIASEERAEELRALLKAAITCGPGRFDASCGALVSFYDDIGLEKCRRAAIEHLRAAWKTEIEPSIVVDRRQGG